MAPRIVSKHTPVNFSSGPTSQIDERSAPSSTVVSLRTYLLGLIVALLTPALAFAALLLWVFHDSGVKQYERDALELTLRLTAALSR